MVQVHVVEPEDRAYYRDELDQQYRIREEIFVQERGWKALRSVRGRERDQFDTDSTIYLLAIEPGVGVVGGSRLHPSMEPTLLNSVFPQLAEEAIPAARDIVEWTRLYCVKSKRDEHPCRTIGAIKAAILEYCLEEEIASITAVAETWYLPRFLRIGWRPRILGIEHDHEDMTLFAFNAKVTEHALAETRHFYDLEGQSLVRARDEIAARRGRGLAIGRWS